VSAACANAGVAAVIASAAATATDAVSLLRVPRSCFALVIPKTSLLLLDTRFSARSTGGCAAFCLRISVLQPLVSKFSIFVPCFVALLYHIQEELAISNRIFVHSRLFFGMRIPAGFFLSAARPAASRPGAVSLSSAQKSTPQAGFPPACGVPDF
jgi:hypothetical protein